MTKQSKQKARDFTLGGICMKPHLEIIRHKLHYYNTHLYYDDKIKKKKPTPPLNWTNSTFDNPYYTQKNYPNERPKVNNCQCLILGQKLFEKRLILLDLDNKEEVIKGKYHYNGVTKWNELMQQHNYNTNTVIAKTGSNGYHYFYLVDETTFNKLNKSYTGLHIDNKDYAIDLKIDKQCAYIEPSYYYKNDEKLEYKFINANFDSIGDAPNFLIELLLNQTPIQKQKLSERLKTIPKQINTPTKASEEEQTIILKILDKLSNEYRKNTSSWLSVGKALYNLGIDVKYYDKWSKGVDNYNKNQCSYRYSLFVRMELSHGIHTLLFLLKNSIDAEKYKEIYDQVYSIDKWKQQKKEYIDNLWNIDKIYDDGNDYNENTININTDYLAYHNTEIQYYDKPKNDKEIFMNQVYNFTNDDLIKTLCIKSHYNSGKTTLLKTILDTNKYERVLFVSYRRSLSYDIQKNLNEYKFDNYLEVMQRRDNLFDCERLIIQYESIKKIDNHSYEAGCNPKDNYYDLLIIDESESVLTQADSSTNKENQRKNFKLLKKLCNISNKMVFLDGDITNKSLSFINNFSENNIVIKNNYQTKKSIHVTRNYGKFFNSIVEDIKQKKKLYICCMSSEDSENYMRKLQDLFLDLKILRIYGTMSEQKKIEIFKNVNEEWCKYDVVLTTPTTESGVSFDVKNYFHKCYGIISTHSTTVRGFLQMIARVRDLKCKNIMIYSDKMILNRVNFYTFEELKENIQTIFEISDKDKTALSDGNNITIKNDDTYVKNYIFNQTEIFNSRSQYFIAYLRLLCKEKGYDFSYEHETSEIKYIKKSYTKVDILDTPCPDARSYEELLVLQKTSGCTEVEKIQIEKYNYFVKTMGYSVAEVKKIEKERNDRIKDKGCTDKDYNLSLTAEREFNRCYKRNIVGNFLSLLDVENMKKIGKLDIEENLNSLKHLDFINDVKEFLLFAGIENISKEYVLKDLKEKIKEKRNELKIFKYEIKDDGKIFAKKKLDEEQSDTQMIWHIKNVLNLFGCDIINDKNRNKTTIEGKRIYKTKYLFKPYEEIKTIIHRKINYNIKNQDKNKLLNQTNIEYDIFEVFDIKK